MCTPNQPARGLLIRLPGLFHRTQQPLPRQIVQLDSQIVRHQNRGAAERFAALAGVLTGCFGALVRQANAARERGSFHADRVYCQIEAPAAVVRIAAPRRCHNRRARGGAENLPYRLDGGHPARVAVVDQVEMRGVIQTEGSLPPKRAAGRAGIGGPEFGIGASAAVAMVLLLAARPFACLAALQCAVGAGLCDRTRRDIGSAEGGPSAGFAAVALASVVGMGGSGNGFRAAVGAFGCRSR